MKKSQINLNQRGFALIATIAILSLVLLVALAMVSLSASTTKSVGYGYHHEIAKANAKLALQTALNQLQRYAGPDQRVTANADILDASISNPYWLGAWKTTVTHGGEEFPAIDRKRIDIGGTGTEDGPHEHKSFFTDARSKTGSWDNAGNWRTSSLKGWLISNPDPTSNADPTLALSASSDFTAARPSVILSGVVDPMKPSTYIVRAPLVPVNGNLGSYAYYVSGENQKANINSSSSLSATIPAIDDSDSLKKLAIGQSRTLSWMDKSNFKDSSALTSTERNKALSFETIKLNNYKTDTNEIDESMRHHVTSDSVGLHTNTQLGGLKTDLSYYFSQGEFPNYTEGGIEYYGINDADSILKAEAHATRGTKFGTLRGWANLDVKNGAGASFSDGDSYATRSIDPLYPRPRTPNRGSSSTVFMEGQAPDYSAPHRVVDNAGVEKTGVPIHPIVVKAKLGVDFSYEESSTTPGLYEIKTMVYPLVSIYNPYNVDIKDVKLAIVFPAKYRAKYPNTTHRLFGANYALDLSLHGAGYAKKTSDPTQDAGGDDFFTQNGVRLTEDKLIFVTEATDFPAGKTLMFSPRQDGLDAFLDKEYNIAAPSNNVLSARQVPENTYFYFNSDAAVINDLGINVNPSLFVPTIRRQIVSFMHNNNLLVKAVTNGANITPSDVSAVTGSVGSNFPTIQQIYLSPQGLNMNSQLTNTGTWGRAINAIQKQVTYNFDASFPRRDFVNRSTYDYEPDAFAARVWEISTFDRLKRQPTAPIIYQANPTYEKPTVASWNIRATGMFRSPQSRMHDSENLRSWGSIVNDTGEFTHEIRLPSGLIDDRVSPDFYGNSYANPIVSSGGYALDFPWGKPGVYQAVTEGVILFDVPSPDLKVNSIGRLRHAPASPFSWDPSYVIGNGFIHSSSDYSATADRNSFDSSRTASILWNQQRQIASDTSSPNRANLADLIGQDAITNDELTNYDIGFELNHRLFDGYFFSSIDYTKSGNFASNTTRTTPWDFYTEELDIANNKALFRTSEFEKELDTSVNNAKKLLLAAKHVGNVGSFNVNSTSVEAWVAFLSSASNTKRVCLNGDELAASVDTTSFSRITVPPTPDRSIDSDNWTMPTTTRDNEINSAIGLNKFQIRTLATAIVAQVRARGPFLSLGDFISRELPDSSVTNENYAPTSEVDLDAQRNTTAFASPIELAIKSASINTPLQGLQGYNEHNLTLPSLKTTYIGYYANNNNHTYFDLHMLNHKQAEYKNQDFPNWLNQGDILEPLAPSMTARDDTFVIRTYGDSRDVDGNIKATAYMEAVVQRCPEFVDGTDASVQPYLRVNGGRTLIPNKDHPAHSSTSPNFGRRIKVVSVKWLNPISL